MLPKLSDFRSLVEKSQSFFQPAHCEELLFFQIGFSFNQTELTKFDLHLLNPFISSSLNALQEAVFVLDKDRKVLFANPVAQSLFASSRIGDDFVKVLRHPSCIGAINAVLGGQSESQTVNASDNTGSTIFQIKITHLNLPPNELPHIIVSLRDVSDIKEATQMRTDFVANVSHELRSPLTALSGFIETLIDDPEMDKAARSNFLGLMNSEASRMVRLIADLLSLSKVESHQRRRPIGSANIESILARVTATLAEQIKQEEKTIDLKFIDKIDTLPGDEDELTQVFQNLIENATKYGKKCSKIKISISRAEQIAGITGEAACIEICDEGEGIARHHIPRLTERFYRVDTHRSRNMGGTGLGLAIVKHIVTRHRGKLIIKSKPKEGSCFTVALPLG